ncbi:MULTISPECIES: FISUMP domain-containing protein [unclassified Fibrobacter]|uniref:FISUMP domain-containing protein n=1 Tax=unclassified Fibrobacter TaxID=2634177 RepID=UPI001304867D|nr:MULTISPECIES: FISUMP domain-containing protein [unclassified Fibrobacter]
MEFTDDRNGRVYKYLKFDGKKCLNFNDKGKCTDEKDTSIYAMVENLNIGKMVDGAQNQNVDNEIERYCYDNDTLICHYYGGLYQWAEMMGFNDSCNTKSCAHLIQENHQGICPDKWRLLTYEDFYIILNSTGNKHGIEGLRSSFGCGGYNETGFSLVCGGENWEYAYDNFDEGVYWFYPEETDSNLLKASGSYTGLSMTTVRKGSYKKTHGFSVRCVKAE